MAALTVTIQPPNQLVLDVSTAHQKLEWRRWKESLELYFTASNLQETKQQRALLLYLGGEELRKIHSTLEDEEGDTYKKAIDVLDGYFSTKINLTYERNVFRNITQQPGESCEKLQL